MRPVLNKRSVVVAGLIVVCLVAFTFWLTTRARQVPENRATINRIIVAEKELCELVNQKVLAQIRDILQTAQSSRERTTVPSELPEIQKQLIESERQQAREFYRDQIMKTDPIDCNAFVESKIGEEHGSI